MLPLLKLFALTLLLLISLAICVGWLMEEVTFDAAFCTLFGLLALYWLWWEHWQLYGRLVPLTKRQILTPERGTLHLPSTALAARLKAQGAMRDEAGRLCVGKPASPDIILYPCSRESRSADGEAWLLQFYLTKGEHLDNEHMRAICTQEGLVAMPHAMRQYKPHGLALWKEGKLAVYPAARAGEFLRRFGALLSPHEPH